MILTRLYELAHRPGERILEDTCFENLPIAFVIVVDTGGVYRGIEDRREWISRPSRKKGEPPRRVSNAGRLLSVPRPQGIRPPRASPATLPTHCSVSCRSPSTRRERVQHSDSGRRSGSRCGTRPTTRTTRP